MGRKQIDKDEYIKKLESEKKVLEKQVKNLERDKRELELLEAISKLLFKHKSEMPIYVTWN